VNIRKEGKVGINSLFFILRAKKKKKWLHNRFRFLYCSILLLLFLLTQDFLLFFFKGGIAESVCRTSVNSLSLEDIEFISRAKHVGARGRMGKMASQKIEESNKRINLYIPISKFQKSIESQVKRALLLACEMK
jgi:hypothetical protein